MSDKINFNVIKPIDEARYLTAENASRYRLIMRYFYQNYERLRYWLSKEDVYNYVKGFDLFYDYTLEKCEQDLKSLTEWKNLIAEQDTGRAQSAEEFKNKKFRYMLSEYSIEIERMTINLEKIKGYGGSLEPSLFQRLYENLKKIDGISKSDDLEAVHRWWKDFTSDFENIYHSAIDYIASLQSSNADELMKTDAFLIYKDKLTEYLRGYIKDLQRFSQVIVSLLNKIDKKSLDGIVEKLLLYEENIPRLDRDFDINDVKENILSKWENIVFWFRGNGDEDSEAYRLLEISNEIIRKITMYAARISENRLRTASRKNEYIKLSKIFADIDDIGYAHKLSSVVFGVFHTRHLYGDFDKRTESINESVWDDVPCKFLIRPKTRSYTQSTKTNAIIDRVEEKEMCLKQYLEERHSEIEEISKYIIDGKIVLRELPIIKPFIRTTLLSWISKSLSQPKNIAKSEDGRTYKVSISRNKVITLNCTDGVLEMPDVTIEFLD
ncbi:TIGR02677 family protein [Thermoanaerobacterium thermosaccharolyticum]|uniref:TIGR02677 family protein n=1 Tax=Thermoanaerobacterium thermosaccharolyticum TaxID=1517 RepID=UPI00123AF2A5|nr:TIGR02677 family protein [Thermoanaerobacterium thermosaccharolyticum]KAA5806433.1 TIGR02677 family protein [Thermoanaerobacterium thermosaccharolyticum]